jgi:hypothetical protein
LPREERKEEYLDMVKSNLSKLKSIKPPYGYKKLEKKSGHHIIRSKHNKEIIVGLAGSSVECIEKCDITQIHGFPEGITYK